ncbi:MAG TPA: alcohol dehydrogenase catalytic domain-containing protein [Acidimicrobiales bacterium]|nr:alcohol dehydrogenase catalytic domain-containing protein [Acidimicrobiales bacterium]
MAGRLMRAWVLGESPGSYELQEVQTPEPGRDDVRVKVVASALNHMDVWLTKGLPKPHLPHVPGADGAGTIDAHGAGVTGFSAGDEVVINPAISCRTCRACLAGNSPYCQRFGIMGEHRWGAHADYVVVPAANVVPKPAGLDWAGAAAYGLCWLTAWRMLKRARLQAGETMLVVGVGGGVSAAGLVLGVYMGARAVVTSRQEAKRARALELGAHEAYDSDAEWPVRADVVFENVGAATWEKSIKALERGGRLVTCGGTAGSNVTISLPRLFFKQNEIIGSTMGSYEEFAEVTNLVTAGVPVLVDSEIAGLESFLDALKRLEAGDQFGKLVLTH